MPTLHMMVGLPCAGKTTLAKRLERETGALRLTPDEWHRHLFGQDVFHPDHDERHTRVEDLMWRVAEEALRRGIDVILDFGFWPREERAMVRERAASCGAATETHFLDAPRDLLFRRAEERNARQAADETHFPLEMLEEWIELFEPPGEDEHVRRYQRRGDA